MVVCGLCGICGISSFCDEVFLTGRELLVVFEFVVSSISIYNEF